MYSQSKNHGSTLLDWMVVRVRVGCISLHKFLISFSFPLALKVVTATLSVRLGLSRCGLPSSQSTVMVRNKGSPGNSSARTRILPLVDFPVGCQCYEGTSPLGFADAVKRCTKTQMGGPPCNLVELQEEEEFNQERPEHSEH